MPKTGKLKGKKTDSLENIPHTLGSNARALIQQKYNDIFSKYEEEFLFLEEILAECKKAFSSNELTLLPKTPSAKNNRRRARRPPPSIDSPVASPPKRRNAVTEEHDENSDSDVVECTPPKKVKTRATRNQNAAGPGRPRLQTTAKNSRAAKNKATPSEETIAEETKKQSTTRSGRTTRQKKSQDPPVLKITKDRLINNQPVFTPPNRNINMIKNNAHIYSPLTVKATTGHVRNKVSAYEQYISPVHENVQNNTNIPETPENEDSPLKTPATVVRHNMSPQTIQQTPNCTPTQTRRSICKSLRRSLKALPSKKKKSMVPNEVKIRHEVQQNSTVTESEDREEEQVKEGKLSEPCKENVSSVEQDSCKDSVGYSDNRKECSDNDQVVTESQNVVTEGNTGKQDSDKNDDVFNSNEEEMDVDQKSSEEDQRSSEGDREASDKDQSNKDREEDDESEDEVMLIDDLLPEDNTTNIKEDTRQTAVDAKGDNCYVDKSDERSDKSSATSDTDNTGSVRQSARIRHRQVTGNDTSCNSSLLHSNSTLQSDVQAESDVKSGDEAKTKICQSEPESGAMTLIDLTVDQSDRTSVESATGKKTRKKAKSKGSQSRTSAESVQPLRQSARTRQRKTKPSSTVTDSDNDTKNVSDVTESSASSSRSRTKTSKAQKAKDTPVSASDSSEVDDPFVVPEVPKPRTTRTKTRKRQMEEDSDTELDTSLSKRSRTESQSDQVAPQSHKVLQISEDSKSVAEEKTRDIPVDSSEDESPVQCPREKVVRPVTSYLNNVKVIHTGRLHTPGINTSGITSFLHRSTPPAKPNPKVTQNPPVKPNPKLTQNPPAKPNPEVTQNPPVKPNPKLTQNPPAKPNPEVTQNPPVKPNPKLTQNPPAKPNPEVTQNPPAKPHPEEIQAARKKELEEKQRKESERLQKREAMMKQRIEEQRKKREERMQNVAKAREQRQKDELEMKNRLAKKLEERCKHIDEQKEEKLKEEEKQKLRRLKKMQEAEERRRQEEEDRLRKLREQEEEEQRINLLKQRQREFEEAERQQKLAEERRQKEERQAELERERRAEMERMKALEEEKEKERIKQKEERERILAKERAERERLELEKKKQKELEYNQKLERLRELEKRRLMEEEKRKQEMKEREAVIHNIVHQKMPQTSSSTNTQTGAQKSNLNTTHTMEPASNPNTYEMTPVKKYKTPSFENYDISDLRSDQSTDEDDAPRKRIPNWALGANLKVALINQYYNPPDLDKLFDKIVPPNLNEIFAKKKARFNHRTSSAHWDSPLLKHGPIPEYY
ncbi:hypothetical protein FSP39_015070 [Pinctada imbricata]|uniref:Inner centromere protein ARK-binding domain-containing protein n=1 Tax=Pinctada imbricata TaxID=66713 RepID=A0AA88Y520_PINIB|nr:hypothetical protein FSP39_015070 [Pinctada imbricata]